MSFAELEQVTKAWPPVSRASLMEVLGVLIEKYEDEHVPELTE